MSGNRHKRCGNNKNSNRHLYANNKQVKVGDSGRKTTSDLLMNEESEIIKSFQSYAHKLDDKHDRYERIVHLSRDITIESKRVIFLLHQTNLTDDEDKHKKTLIDAETRLNGLIKSKFKAIAKELIDLDAYEYLRAFTAGLQEFTESLLLLHYVRDGNLLSYDQISEKFVYAVEECQSEEDTFCSKASPTDEVAASSEKLEDKGYHLFYPYIDYVLGLADFTGELMRMCINGLGNGKSEQCFELCNHVKDILIGYLSLNTVGFRELNRKLHVLKQSLNKMEYVCFNIKVRGSEVPKHVLVHVIESSDEPRLENDDEGFYG